MYVYIYITFDKYIFSENNTNSMNLLSFLQLNIVKYNRTDKYIYTCIYLGIQIPFLFKNRYLNSDQLGF